MICKMLLCFVKMENQLPKNRENQTCKALSVYIENSISPKIFNKFHESWFQNLSSIVLYSK